MAVTLTGAGGWFTRLGHLAGWLNDINSLVGGTATTNVLSGAQVPTRLAQAESDASGGTADYTAIDGLATQCVAYQSVHSGFLTYLQQLASTYTVDMANADTVLTSRDIRSALALIASQMVTNSNTLNSCTIAIGNQTAVGSPTGNPIFVWTTKDGAGRGLQYVFPETITAVITLDAQNGGTANQESFTMSGQNAQSNLLAFDWLGTKYGSGATQTSSLTDATLTNSGGNLLANSDFLTYTNTNVPDNFVVTVGVAGTNIFNGTSSNAYTTGGGSLQFTGDGGGTLAALTQAFNTTTSTTLGAGGTPATLQSGYLNNACYALNCWLKVSATPGAGVVEFSLVDGSGTTIADDQGTNNLATKSLTAVSTSFVNVNTVFRLPAVLPSTIKLKVRLSTAIDNGKSVYIGRLALTKMAQMYPGGPSFAGFSGNTNVQAAAVQPDSWTFGVTNTPGTLQKMLWRFFNPAAYGIYFNNSGSPSISDSLVA